MTCNQNQNQFSICSKIKFNGGLFYKEVSKFSYFKMWKNVKIKWLNKLAVKFNSRAGEKFAAKMK